MKLIWTKSKLPLSVLIRAITGEDCSHFAFVFETKAQGLLFESNLLGTHPVFLNSMLSSFGDVTLVHAMDLPLSLDDENKVWDLIVAKYDDKPYDFLGAIYLGYRILLKRIFKIPIPAKNAWAESGTYYCDELYNILTQIPGVPQVQVEGAMKTPHDLWLALEGSSN